MLTMESRMFTLKIWVLTWSRCDYPNTMEGHNGGLETHPGVIESYSGFCRLKLGQGGEFWLCTMS